ncbi:hypothetical protein IVB30_43115 [Bradyrhizobium sp. 200]|nr:hypothetical protein IVB30_43115 [Bradyrhizobium sp. 200]
MPRDDHERVEEYCVLDGYSAGEFLLIRAGTAQKTPLLRNPLGALQMAQVCIPRTVRLALWIDMQDYSRDVSPISVLAIGLQKARVRHDMLFVIGRQRRIGWRDIRYVRIKRWF